MKKKVLFIASNYGLWAEELEAPWTALRNAGHELTLATYLGKTPLPIAVSLDPEFIDPLQNYKVNPQDVIDRVNSLLNNGEWSNPLKTNEVDMKKYDALVIVGGPGAPLDITGNSYVHDIIYSAYRDKKVIGALCYAVAALSFTRDPENDNRSILYGKSVTAHPHSWDFNFDMAYDLVNATNDNPGTNLKTCGFVYPLQYMVEDAVGNKKLVISDATANREKPSVVWDAPFLTALSVESSIEFGKRLAELI